MNVRTLLLAISLAAFAGSSVGCSAAPTPAKAPMKKDSEHHEAPDPENEPGDTDGDGFDTSGRDPCDAPIPE